MSKCYKCGAEIDGDSLFCDQCGTEQYVCEKCRRIGKGPGKRCGMCGSPLVPATESKDKNEEKNNVGKGAEKNTTEPIEHEKAGAAIPTPASLVCHAKRITIPLADGAVIGRTTGNYTSQLCQCIYISGTHARLSRTDLGWTITDLGSRNGTMVNGSDCIPHKAVPFKLGDTVRLGAFYDFTVE